MSELFRSIKRAWGNFVGPEATRVDNCIAIGSAVIGLIGAGLRAKRRGANGKIAMIMAVMAADLVGGTYVNNTRACVRWYERAGQGTMEHLTFAALHVHPGVVGWADRSFRGVRPGVCGPRRTTATWFYLLQPSDRALRNEEFLEWRWQPEVYVSTDHLGGRP